MPDEPNELKPGDEIEMTAGELIVERQNRAALNAGHTALDVAARQIQAARERMFSTLREMRPALDDFEFAVDLARSVIVLTGRRHNRSDD